MKQAFNFDKNKMSDVILEVFILISLIFGINFSLEFAISIWNPYCNEDIKKARMHSTKEQQKNRLNLKAFNLKID
jgi:hypothetical protein